VSYPRGPAHGTQFSNENNSIAWPAGGPNCRLRMNATDQVSTWLGAGIRATENRPWPESHSSPSARVPGPAIPQGISCTQVETGSRHHLKDPSCRAQRQSSVISIRVLRSPNNYQQCRHRHQYDYIGRKLRHLSSSKGIFPPGRAEKHLPRGSFKDLPSAEVARPPISANCDLPADGPKMRRALPFPPTMESRLRAPTVEAARAAVRDR